VVLKLYRDDIEKYGGMAAKRIKAVFDAIPGQLAKHEKRLVYTQVSKGARSRDFMTAFSWLREAMTANLCTLSEDPSLGLALSEDETTVKCYLADTGLLSSMAFDAIEDEVPSVYRQVLRGDAGVNEGMLVENYVAQQLVARGHALHFYARSSSDRAERMEVDFLVVRPFPDAAMKARVSPVEVKSGKRYSLVSLEKFARKFAGHVGEEIVLHTGQLRVEQSRLFLPLYMAHLL
jgi:predicted AAA+ superfamily ATPase